MPKPHKDLPGGSQAWAAEVDALIEENKQLREVVRQLAANAGIDFANPKRGINTGATPSVKNPVAQKLSSLEDTATYNVLDGQVLSWSQAGQKWLPVEQSGGMEWVLATEEEHLWGDLDNDSDYYSTSVIGLRQAHDEGSGDGYGLVGSSTSSAFLHAAQRWWGGPTKAHGYVSAEPYYVKMGVEWIDDTGSTYGNDKGFEAWGQVSIDRESVYLKTPTGQPSTSNANAGMLERDGSISLLTNWFYVPQVNGVYSSYYNINYPKRPVPLVGSTPSAGGMVYDMTLKKPIFWDGTKWVDAMGNDIPAPLY
jgi:hypothetical protein